MLYTVGETAKKPGRVTYTKAATRKRNTKNTKKTSEIKIILICLGERIHNSFYLKTFRFC